MLKLYSWVQNNRSATPEYVFLSTLLVYLPARATNILTNIEMLSKKLNTKEKPIANTKFLGCNRYTYIFLFMRLNRVIEKIGMFN